MGGKSLAKSYVASLNSNPLAKYAKIETNADEYISPFDTYHYAMLSVSPLRADLTAPGVSTATGSTLKPPMPHVMMPEYDLCLDGLATSPPGLPPLPTPLRSAGSGSGPAAYPLGQTLSSSGNPQTLADVHMRRYTLRPQKIHSSRARAPWKYYFCHR